MLQQTVNLINLTKWKSLRSTESFKEEQIEVFLYSIHDNFNYWFNLYVNSISKNYEFRIRKNTIYGDWEISCQKYLNADFLNLSEIQFKLKNTNSKIANISLGNSIDNLGIDRAFLKVMNEKLNTFLIEKLFVSDVD